MRPRIVAVDFDGTIVEHKYPDIGKPLPYAIETLKALRENGIRVFLWSMRGHPDLERFPHLDLHTGEFIPKDTLQEAIDFCKEQGLEFDGINESPEQFSTSLKQYAHLYIDDTALGCPHTKDGWVDWYTVIYILYEYYHWLTTEQVSKILKPTTF